MKNNIVSFYRILSFSLPIVIGTHSSFSQSVGIGTLNPDDKAILDIHSTNKGLLIPRMTTSQRDLIASPPEGMMIYNTTTDNFNVFDSNSWKAMQKELPSGTMLLSEANEMPGLTELDFLWDGHLYLNFRGESLPVIIPDSSWYMANQNDPDIENTPNAVLPNFENYRVFGFNGCDMIFLRADSNFRFDSDTDTWTFNANSFLGGIISDPLPAKGVWTGTEIIFWNEQSGANSKFYRFNPQTNVFTSVQVSHSLSSRMGYSFIQAGSELIIMWGGETAPNVTHNNGFIYNIVTNTLAEFQMPAGSDLEPRAYHSAIWTGTEMIVFGGYDYCNFSKYSLDSGFRYNMGSQTFTPLTIGLGRRSNHTSTYVNNKMVVFGGREHFSYLSTCNYQGAFNINWCDVYDLNDNTWTSIPHPWYAIIPARYDHNAFLFDDVITFVGGFPPTTLINRFDWNTSTFLTNHLSSPVAPWGNNSCSEEGLIVSPIHPDNNNSDHLALYIYTRYPVPLLQAAPIQTTRFTLWRKE